MTSLLLQLALAATFGAEAPTFEPVPDDGRVAINPNLAIGDCVGGADQLSLSSGVTVERSGTMVGSHEVQAVTGSPECYGYVPELAHYCISVPPGGGTYTIEITAAESTDTILALVSADRTFSACDDDGGNGLLSRIEARLEAGTYLLWVGTYSAQVSGSYRLTASVR